MNTETFPIDLNALEPLKLDPGVSHLTDAEKSSLKHNIQLWACPVTLAERMTRCQKS
jgi:hypothetical protein